MTAAFEHPVQALIHQANSSPEEPWLLFRTALDWQWYSFAQIAAAVAVVVQELRRLPAGSRIAFQDRGDPDSVVIDLAVLAAGHHAIPVDEEALALGASLFPGETAQVHWAEAAHTAELSSEELSLLQSKLELPWQGLKPLLLPALADTRSFLRSPVKKDRELRVDELLSAKMSFVGGDSTPRIWTTENLAQATRAVCRNLEKVPRRDARDVIVAHRTLREEGHRLVISCALQLGWGVVLEPLAEATVATVGWARPTLLYGTAEQLEPWHLEPKRKKTWWKKDTRLVWPRPLDRLRAVLIAGEREPSREEIFWRDRGMTTISLRESFPEGAVV